MSTFEAILLGIIQGITEFFPVSSSGHLKLVQALLGLKNLDRYIIFDLVCHLGTLFAICLIYAKQLREAFTVHRIVLWKVILATLPLFPLVFLLGPIKTLFNRPEYLGYFFLFTAFLLYLGIRFGTPKNSQLLTEHPWRDSILIGIFQAIAILPGISRSGSTISGARLLGWNLQQAITFSFLLAIPAILGGTVLETALLIFKQDLSLLPAIGWGEYLAGFSTSFAAGCLALILLQKLAVKDKFIYFVWYCLIIGIFSCLYF